jgi:hypothetical protein
MAESELVARAERYQLITSDLVSELKVTRGGYQHISQKKNHLEASKRLCDFLNRKHDDGSAMFGDVHVMTRAEFLPFVTCASPENFLSKLIGGKRRDKSGSPKKATCGFLVGADMCNGFKNEARVTMYSINVDKLRRFVTGVNWQAPNWQAPVIGETT